jgi:dolichol-phosphate mannosyltransferase
MSPQPISSLALIIPAYNEAEGLPELFAALEKVRSALSHMSLRVLIVDDHSDDATPALLSAAANERDWLDFIRLSRRSGSHVAIIAGLSRCSEDFAAFVAADLQDPPELLGEMLDKARQGNDVVWAVRANTDGQGWLEMLTSRLFHRLMRVISDVGQLPFQASFALLTKRAYTGLVRNAGARASLIVEIPALGFGVATVPFVRRDRVAGRSKWNVSRKLAAFADATVASSSMPLRAMTYLGLVTSTVGFLYAAFLVLRYFRGDVDIQGWTSIMVAVLVIGGLQMLMLGVLGQYLWRTNENARGRALFIVEKANER